MTTQPIQPGERVLLLAFSIEHAINAISAHLPELAPDAAKAIICHELEHLGDCLDSFAYDLPARDHTRTTTA